MHSINISLLILYTLATLCFLAIVAICLLLWREDPINNDYQRPKEAPVKDLQDSEKMSIKDCSEQAKYYDGPPMDGENMK